MDKSGQKYTRLVDNQEEPRVLDSSTRAINTSEADPKPQAQDHESGNPHLRNVSQYSSNSRILAGSQSAYPPYLMQSAIGHSAHNQLSPVDQQMTFFIFKSVKLT